MNDVELYSYTRHRMKWQCSSDELYSCTLDKRTVYYIVSSYEVAQCIYNCWATFVHVCMYIPLHRASFVTSQNLVPQLELHCQPWQERKCQRHAVSTECHNAGHSIASVRGHVLGNCSYYQRIQIFGRPILHVHWRHQSPGWVLDTGRIRVLYTGNYNVVDIVKVNN
jgi:hypothetical protein